MSVGSMILLNADKEALTRDVAKTREMEKREMEKNNELFELKQSADLSNAVSSLNLFTFLRALSQMKCPRSVS